MLCRIGPIFPYSDPLTRCLAQGRDERRGLHSLPARAPSASPRHPARRHGAVPPQLRVLEEAPRVRRRCSPLSRRSRCHAHACRSRPSTRSFCVLLAVDLAYFLLQQTRTLLPHALSPLRAVSYPPLTLQPQSSSSPVWATPLLDSGAHSKACSRWPYLQPPFTPSASSVSAAQPRRAPQQPHP